MHRLVFSGGYDRSETVNDDHDLGVTRLVMLRYTSLGTSSYLYQLSLSMMVFNGEV